MNPSGKLRVRYWFLFDEKPVLKLLYSQYNITFKEAQARAKAIRARHPKMELTITWQADCDIL